MKSTPMRGVKESLKPHAYKQWEEGLSSLRTGKRLTTCLLHNESASYYTQRQVKPNEV